MSHRASHVFSVELKPALAAFGRSNLERHGAENVTLEIGDAARGWAAHAPYDVIVLTGSTPILPRSAVEQLAPGGRLFAVVGEPPVMSARIVVRSNAATAPGVWRSTDLFETVILPLANAERGSRFRF
jgi:protein-L-isoaspartate(D-aspartate) O-methyltransferase